MNILLFTDMTNREFGAWLKKCRESAGKTASEAAMIFGCTRTAWHQWESGKCRPQGRFMLPILKEWGPLEA